MNSNLIKNNNPIDRDVNSKIASKISKRINLGTDPAVRTWKKARGIINQSDNEANNDHLKSSISLPNIEIAIRKNEEEIPRIWSENDIHSSIVQASFTAPESLIEAKTLLTDHIIPDLQNNEDTLDTGMWLLESPKSVHNFEIQVDQESIESNLKSTCSSPIETCVENKNIQELESYLSEINKLHHVENKEITGKNNELIPLEIAFDIQKFDDFINFDHINTFDFDQPALKGPENVAEENLRLESEIISAKSDQFQETGGNQDLYFRSVPSPNGSESVSDDESVFKSVSTPLSPHSDDPNFKEINVPSEELKKLKLSLNEENIESRDLVELKFDRKLDSENETDSPCFPTYSVQDENEFKIGFDEVEIFFDECEILDLNHGSVQNFNPELDNNSQDLESFSSTSSDSINEISGIETFYDSPINQNYLNSELENNSHFDSATLFPNLSLIHPDYVLNSGDNLRNVESYEFYDHESEGLFIDPEMAYVVNEKTKTSDNLKEDDEYSIADVYGGEEVIQCAPEFSDPIPSFKIKIKSKKKSKSQKLKSKLSRSSSSSSDSSSSDSSDSNSSSSYESSDSDTESSITTSSSSSDDDDKKVSKKIKFRSSSPTLPRRGPAPKFKINPRTDDSNFKIKMNTEIFSDKKLVHQFNTETLGITSDNNNDDDASQIIKITWALVISFIILAVIINRIWIKFSVTSNSSRLNN